MLGYNEAKYLFLLQYFLKKPIIPSFHRSIIPLVRGREPINLKGGYNGRKIGSL
jgi:hypothetical protein